MTAPPFALPFQCEGGKYVEGSSSRQLGLCTGTVMRPRNASRHVNARPILKTTDLQVVSIGDAIVMANFITLALAYPKTANMSIYQTRTIGRHQLHH